MKLALENGRNNLQRAPADRYLNGLQDYLAGGGEYALKFCLLTR